MNPTRYYSSKENTLSKDIDKAKVLAANALDRLLSRGADMSNLKVKADDLGTISDLFKKNSNEIKEEEIKRGKMVL